MLLSLLVLPSSISAKDPKDNPEFSEYVQQQNTGFKKYITDQEKAFAVYKEIYNKASIEYKKNIGKNWDKTEVSTNKKWVSYSGNLNQKTIVDYEKKQVTIFQKVLSGGDVEARIKMQKKIDSLKNMTYKKAYQLDPLATKVDKQLSQKISPNILLKSKPTDKKIHIIEKAPKIIVANIKTKNLSQDKGRILSYSFPLGLKSANSRVKSVLFDVNTQAERQKIPPSLMLAIIKNESAFNPLAKSHIPAYGLMQIVPRSAGKDATKYLFGKQKLLSASYLYTPEKNIEMGAAYMHILYYRYLKHIKNPESRTYCTIAAYNTGAGNVAKSFIGSYNIRKASREINKLTPKEVYQHLRNNLPYDETKKYLKKVTKSYEKYSKLYGNS